MLSPMTSILPAACAANDKRRKNPAEMNFSIDTSSPMVEVASLGKEVPSGDGRLVILHEISFRVMAGEAVAIVGASGSGKSTLLALLAGLDTPSVGRVEVEGADLFALDEDARAELRGRSVGFVFQSFQLLPSLTALENVMLPLELRRDAQAEAKARDILARVGLAQRLGHYPKHLSGGEQQRVALARAFSVRPKLLFADEPTGSLDADSGDAVIDLVFELNRDFGTTLVMVTHDEHLAQRCGRSVRLVAGRIAGA
jgi:putative ABC transport system ATP-binding protein